MVGLSLLYLLKEKTFEELVLARQRKLWVERRGKMRVKIDVNLL